ncbi:hypothetical protein SBA3_2660008 [Candidatus Sulfopaludibacter sp. SbA3]|nr:hypothetical protein SBA3_2660008 [Candidatus Sulfopaludibacter sp. SbA3]
MELWLGKRIPTRSIFIVTHNIEEAVLLADRVLVLGRNPARIRADFHIPLPQPGSAPISTFPCPSRANARLPISWSTWTTFIS